MTDTPIEIPPLTRALARVDELGAALNVAMERRVALNVEVRIRDAEIERLREALIHATTEREAADD